MGNMRVLRKEQQELMPLFDGAFIENKPIPFPQGRKTTAYSSLFYWAHLDALETSEFPLHPHEGFEIMTFVLEGSLEHYDTATQVWTPLEAGGVQVIQAGSGVKHAERIIKGTKMFQIWFDPDFSISMREKASYQDYPASRFKPLIHDDIKEYHYIGKTGVSAQTPELEVRRLQMNEGGYEEALDIDSVYSFYLIKGEVKLDEQVLKQDDFWVLEAEAFLKFDARKDADIFIIKTPKHIEYERFMQRYD